jgi:hypothetical protein
MSREALTTGLEDKPNQKNSSNMMKEGVLKVFLEKIGEKVVREWKGNLEK